MGQLKQNNICITGVPEGKENKKGADKLFEETMAENLPNVEKERHFQVQDAQRVPNKMNSKISTARNIIMKMSNDKDKKRVLKAAKGRQVGTYNGTT